MLNVNINKIFMKINYFSKQNYFARKWVLPGLTEKSWISIQLFLFNLLFWLTNVKIYSRKKYLNSLFR